MNITLSVKERTNKKVRKWRVISCTCIQWAGAY